MTTPRITVFLADDTLLVREGVRALLAAQPDLEVVGVAEDYDGLVARRRRDSSPQVVVTDIRMPPNFQNEGIEAAKQVRKRHPGTGVVILSQYDEPEYAISLLSEGAAGYAYLLKDRVGDGDQLVPRDPRGRDRRQHARPRDRARARRAGARRRRARRARGAAAAVDRRGPAGEGDRGRVAHDARSGERRDRRAVPRSSRKEASAGREGALRRLRLLQKAIVDREEQGETLQPPAARAASPRSCASDGRAIGETERLVVTVLMSDVRGYSGIAERVDPTVLAGQLNTHRAEMNTAILAEGGTVMQYVGDAVMAVFGAPFPQDDHADRALARPRARCTSARTTVNEQVARRRAARVRTRHRPVDRRGRGRAARLRRAARVHARRRHREPGAAAAGPGAPGRDDRAERARRSTRCRRARRSTPLGEQHGEGTGDARASRSG